MFNALGAMKPTFSKMQQPHDHKRKMGPMPPIPEPKKQETPQVQMNMNPTPVTLVNEIRSASNNGIIENTFEGMPSQGPVKQVVEDRYLYVIIGCCLFYLWSTHAPDRFQFIST